MRKKRNIYKFILRSEEMYSFQGFPCLALIRSIKYVLRLLTVDVFLL